VTTPQITLLVILLALFLLLLWGRWRYDVVAFSALMAAVVSGIVPANEAFLGFGHPATVTVAAILLLSRALLNSGATDFATRLIRPAEARQGTHIASLAGIAAGLSAFMNNVGTLGLLLPVTLQSAKRAGRAAGLLLMPLSFGAILGGLITMIGTPPNIIVATYRAQVAGAEFSMFDFTPVGLVTALAGVAFIASFGWRLIPESARSGGADAGLLDIENYITELVVPEDCPQIGKTLKEIEELTEDVEAVVVDLIRGKQRFSGAAWQKQLAAGDVLKIEAGPEALDKFRSKVGLELADSAATKTPTKKEEDLSLAEAVVAPGSRLEGRRVGGLRLFRYRAVALLAISRQGKPFRGRLKDFVIRRGDVLLLHGDADRLPDAIAAAGCLPLAERALSFGRRRHAPAIAGIFLAAVAAASFGLLPIQIAFGLAVAALVVTGLLPVRELYDGIDWPVIVLLGSLIPVGGALETTGTTGVITEVILFLAADLPVAMVLLLIMAATMTLSDILNNAATAVVMAPIGAAVAADLGVSADPFLMGIAVAASCAFLTPIGHQNNALIMGPGGYRFGDYWRMGLPLEVIIIAVALPMILWVWPL